MPYDATPPSDVGLRPVSATTLTAYEISAGLFVRGLTNLKIQLTKAADEAAAIGTSEAAMLKARLAETGGANGAADYAPRDLHAYTLSAQVHWAAEGARLAILQLLDEPLVPAANVAASFEDLHQRLDATIAFIRETSPGELEAGLDRDVVVAHPRGSVRSSGRQFLVAFAIPHFFYHLTASYSILRNQGAQLTMGDFLGNWGNV